MLNFLNFSHLDSVYSIYSNNIEASSKFGKYSVMHISNRSCIQGWARGSFDEAEAEAESSRPRRGRAKSMLFVPFWYHAQCTCSSYVFLLCGQWHLSMKNTTEKFHNKYNTHCYCVVTVICTNIIFYEIPEEAETLRITLPLGHLLKNWTNFWCI